MDRCGIRARFESDYSTLSIGVLSWSTSWSFNGCNSETMYTPGMNVSQRMAVLMGSSPIVGDGLRVGSDVITFYKSFDFEAVVDINH